MGTYENILSLFGGDLKSKAVELGYSPANLCILDGNADELKRRFEKCFNKLVSCQHASDSRSIIEYGRDIVSNWILEDTIVQKLNAEGNPIGLKIVLTGADKNREILLQRMVSARSDCSAEANGKKRNLEIAVNFTNYWHRFGKVDLRDAKYNMLVSEKSLFLGLCLKTKKYMLLDFTKGLNVTHIPSHEPWGGKPANSIALEPSDFCDLHVADIVQKIKDAIDLSE